jgi:hypothetical protein
MRKGEDDDKPLTHHELHPFSLATKHNDKLGACRFLIMTQKKSLIVTKKNQKMKS